MIVENIGDLEKEVSNNPERRFYAVFGDEEYLCRKALDLLKEKLLDPNTSAFNYTEFNAETATAAEIANALNTFPFMTRHRFVLLIDVQDFPDRERDELAALMQSSPVRNVLVLSGSAIDRRTTFYKRLSQIACVGEFAKLKGPALELWAANYMKRQGLRLSAAALKKLLETAGSDLRNLKNEIDKLAIYAGAKQTVADSVVEQLVAGNPEHGIFELIGALGKRERSKALHLLGNLLNGGEHPLVVVTMLARHFRQVLIAKGLQARGARPREIGAAAQIPHFILDEFLRQARSMDETVATELYLRLTAMDRLFKSSGINERMALENLICSI